MAEGNGKQIWLNWLAGVMATIILTLLGLLGNNVIANDRIRANEDSRLDTRITGADIQVAEIRECMKSVKEDLSEIKSILKRTSPYERK